MGLRPLGVVAALLALSTILAGCVAPGCRGDRLSVDGRAPGLLAALPAPPDDLAPAQYMHLEPWYDGDTMLQGLITSGRPWQLVDDVERMFALRYGAGEGAVLMVWQGDEVEVQVYAADEDARDRLLDAVRDAAPGVDGGASTRQPRDPPYAHDLSGGSAVRDPWVFRLPAGAVAMEGILEEPHVQERHVGWWAWALSHSRSLTLRSGNGVIEMTLRPDESFSAQVKFPGDEQALHDRFQGFLARWDVEPTLDQVRYVEGDCDFSLPST